MYGYDGEFWTLLNYSMELKNRTCSDVINTKNYENLSNYIGFWNSGVVMLPSVTYSYPKVNYSDPIQGAA